MKTAAILAVSLLTLSACTSRAERADDDEQLSSSRDRDLSNTDANIDGVKGGEDYGTYDDRRDSLTGLGDVGGYGCTLDCGGHDAGRQWAEDHDITDSSDCGGNSWSFQEGCVAYTEEQQQEDDTDGGSDDQTE